MAITLKKLKLRADQLIANNPATDHLFIPFLGGQGSASKILTWFAAHDNLSKTLDGFTNTQITTAINIVYAALDPIDKAIADLIVTNQNYTPEFSSQRGYELVVIYILLKSV